MLHSALTKIHVLENWTYATAAARTGATGFVTADLGKIAYQQDTGQYYRLTAITPTWQLIQGIGATYPQTAGAAGQVPRSDGTNFVSAVLNAADISPVPGSFIARAIAVNFNSANTDTAITIVLPTGYTRWKAHIINITHPSIAMGTATFGVFTATSGGGVAIVTAGASTAGLTSAAENTNGNSIQPTINNAATISYNISPIYFRVGTAQGVAATADVELIYFPVP